MADTHYFNHTSEGILDTRKEIGGILDTLSKK
jgi:hypothetical protein